MRITEAKFRQIIKEEARRVLSEETAIAGITVAGLEQFATNKLKNTAKSMAIGRATGLGAVAAPVSVSLETMTVTISAAALGPYLLASAAITGIVMIADSAWGTFKIMNAAADRNTKAAISQAKILLWTAGINSGKNQGIFSPPILESLRPTYKKFATVQPVQKINQYRAMAYDEYPNPAVELSQEDKKNIGIVFSMLTSADIDKAFSDAKQAVIDRGSSKINDEIYNTTIADFKTKISELQTAVADQVASLKVNQLIRQMYAQEEKERQTPAAQAAEKAAQAAEQARLAALGREADKADFARGIVPASYKPVKR